MSTSSTARLSTACLSSMLSSQLLSAAAAPRGTGAPALGAPGSLSETTSSWDSAQTTPVAGMNLAKPQSAATLSPQELTALSEAAPSGLSMKIAAASPTAAIAAAAAGAAAAQSASSAQAPYGAAQSAAPYAGLEAIANGTRADQQDGSETTQLLQADLSTDALGSLSQRLNVSLRQVSERKSAAAYALGVKKDAGRSTIQNAFKQQALHVHPDKGGNAADFQVLSEARRKMAGS